MTNVTIVNGQFPGPLIEANWGDTVRKLLLGCEFYTEERLS